MRPLVRQFAEMTGQAIKDLRQKLEARMSGSDARIAALEGRVAALDGGKAVAPAPEHKAGEVVEMGGGKWLCRGAGRYRKIEGEA